MARRFTFCWGPFLLCPLPLQRSNICCSMLTSRSSSTSSTDSSAWSDKKAACSVVSVSRLLPLVLLARRPLRTDGGGGVASEGVEIKSGEQRINVSMNFQPSRRENLSTVILYVPPPCFAASFFSLTHVHIEPVSCQEFGGALVALRCDTLCHLLFFRGAEFLHLAQSRRRYW